MSVCQYWRMWQFEALKKSEREQMETHKKQFESIRSYKHETKILAQWFWLLKCLYKLYKLVKLIPRFTTLSI